MSYYRYYRVMSPAAAQKQSPYPAIPDWVLGIVRRRRGGRRARTLAQSIGQRRRARGEARRRATCAWECPGSAALHNIGEMETSVPLGGAVSHVHLY